MQKAKDNAYMKQVTIRRVDEACLDKARAEAKRRGISLDEILRESLRRGLGIAGDPPRKKNLDKYAGDFDFGSDWDEFLDKDLQKIDEELWR